MSNPTHQMDYLMPSSDRPPVWEWAGHSWYVLFAAAAQAGPKHKDPPALVAWMASLHAALPCGECAEHYRENWARAPYTQAHALDQATSKAWALNLRSAVDQQVAARRAAERRLVSNPPAGMPSLPAHACSCRDRQANLVAAAEAVLAKRKAAEAAGSCGCPVPPAVVVAPCWQVESSSSGAGADAP